MAPMRPFPMGKASSQLLAGAQSMSEGSCCCFIEVLPLINLEFDG